MLNDETIIMYIFAPIIAMLIWVIMKVISNFKV